MCKHYITQLQQDGKTLSGLSIPTYSYLASLESYLPHNYNIEGIYGTTVQRPETDVHKMEENRGILSLLTAAWIIRAAAREPTQLDW